MAFELFRKEDYTRQRLSGHVRICIFDTIFDFLNQQFKDKIDLFIKFGPSTYALKTFWYYEPQNLLLVMVVYKFWRLVLKVPNVKIDFKFQFQLLNRLLDTYFQYTEWFAV